MKTAAKSMSHGVSKYRASPTVRNKMFSESFIEEVNQKRCVKKNFFKFVDNKNISNAHLFDDGLHLVESGRCISANHVIDPLNDFY